MIKECFRTETGIIFDAHMLQHEVGFDIDHPCEAPPRLSPEGRRMRPPGKNSVPELINFVKIIWASISMPFSWLISEIPNLRVRSEPTPAFTVEENLFVSKGEQREELDDALSPVYDQLSMHWYWKIMEWIPWITKKQSAEIDGSDAFWAYQFMYVWCPCFDSCRLLV
jgi:hypothetical protein